MSEVAYLTGRARLAGVMGWPVGHSLSPRLHGHWLRRHGIDGAYLPLAVPPDRLEQALRALPALAFRGCNLTIPHKEAALALVDRATPLARRIGAVNTVVVEPDDSLSGDNTDGFGFLASLAAGRPDWRAEAGPAVLLGAGGDNLKPLLTADKFLSLVSLMIVAFGIAFEFPVVLMFLLIARVVNTQQLRSFRRWAIVLIFAFAAIITPSQDPYSLFLMAIPLVLFYEACIIIGRIMKR